MRVMFDNFASRRYFVGVLNKKRSKLKVCDAQIFRMVPKIPGMSECVDFLTEAFGSHRSKRALSSRRLNVVGTEKLEQTVAAVAHQVIEEKGAEALSDAVSRAQNTHNLSHLPPCCPDAGSVAEIYSLSNRILLITILITLPSLPTFTSLPPSLTRVRMVQLTLDWFVPLWCSGSMTRVITPPLKDKLNVYALAIALHISDFKMDITHLRADLKVSQKKIVELGRAMGLRIKHASVSKNQKTKPEFRLEDIHWQATLQLPFVLPEPPVARKKKWTR
uniref:Uncharacterized protein n=1 Tax=Eptatretus burgeri TaxID=7764 RepID=A0A8C4WX82_EPTBU